MGASARFECDPRTIIHTGSAFWLARTRAQLSPHLAQEDVLWRIFAHDKGAVRE